MVPSILRIPASFSVKHRNPAFPGFFHGVFLVPLRGRGTLPRGTADPHWRGLWAGGCIAFCAALGGCAFDVVSVPQSPVVFNATTGVKGFVLMQDLKVHIGTGFATRLRANTSWHKVGATVFGDVYTTQDQIVTVEASNIYEAQIVVSGIRNLVGFYLPVEHSYVSLKEPLPLTINPNPRPP